MKRIEKHLITATAIITLVGCAQLKQKPAPARAERLTVEGSVAEPYGDCSRGLFEATLYRDWVSKEGAPVLKGKGFMTKEPLPQGVTAGYILAHEAKIYGKNAPDLAKVKYADLGKEVIIDFGAVPAPEIVVSEEGMVSKAQLVRSGDAEDSPPVSGVSLVKDKNIYKGTSALSKDLVESSEKSSTDTEEEAPAAPKRKVQSLVITNKKLATQARASNLPEHVEGGQVSFAEGVAGVTLGQPFKIPVVPSTAKQGATWLAVEVSEDSDAPKWAAMYRVEDKGQSEIEVKTVWETSKGKQQKMHAGKNDVRVLVTRSQLQASEVQGGGNLCVQTSVGALTKSKIAEPPKN